MQRRLQLRRKKKKMMMIMTGSTRMCLMGICLVMMIGEVGASRGLPNHAAAKSGGARRREEHKTVQMYNTIFSLIYNMQDHSERMTKVK